MEDKMPILYLKCPYCRKGSKWARITSTRAATFVVFNFGNMTEKSEIVCPACKKDFHYLDIVKALIIEMTANRNRALFPI
ncbi:hypothetical protein [Desulfosporosinus sp. SB140]|uniref:hypothetical protein n=1 Tax=Desulfosporosinus paludis TaxID=3115649 RepID=UPI00388E3555